MKQKEILTTKIKQKCSMREAKQQHENQSNNQLMITQTYSSAAASKKILDSENETPNKTQQQIASSPKLILYPVPYHQSLIILNPN